MAGDSSVSSQASSPFLLLKPYHSLPGEALPVGESQLEALGI